MLRVLLVRGEFEFGRFVPGEWFERPRLRGGRYGERRRFSVGAFGFWLCVWWRPQGKK